MAKIDLSEFLPKKKGSLDEFLTPSAKPVIEAPKEVLSNAECLVLFWKREICGCGRTYESQDHGPMLRHTLFRRQGFGLHNLGKVYIPLLPNMDCSDLPQETKIAETRIHACPECLGSRPSYPLFSDTPPAFIVNGSGTAGSPHQLRWLQQHSTSNQLEVEKTLHDMQKRGVDIDDLLQFKTTELDYRSAFQGQTLCDPEKDIE